MKKTTSNPKTVVDHILLDLRELSAKELGEFARVLGTVANLVEEYATKSEAKPFKDYARAFNRAAARRDME